MNGWALLQPNLLGWIALACTIVMLALAVLVFLAGHLPRNRHLATFFFGVAGWWAASGVVVMSTDPTLSYGLALGSAPAVFLFHWGYLRFLASLPTPLARPLASRPFRLGLATVLLGLFAWVLFEPTHWQRGAVPGPGGSWINDPGPVWAWFDAASLFMLIFALIAAVSAYRRATTPSIKRQMRYYLIAFLGYDATLLAMLAAVLVAYSLTGAIAGLWFLFFMAPAALWLGVWLSYGMLKHQLFDIDLKIKWTVNRGTLVAIFLAVFFIVTVTAENFLTDRYGWAIGGVGAGLLLFVLAPLQRFADRVANATMPGVQDTKEYRMVRKRDVYHAAVEAAVSQGGINLRERAMLARLQEELGLTATDAHAVEAAIGGEARA